jgi:hypothetical protein
MNSTTILIIKIPFLIKLESLLLEPLQLLEVLLLVLCGRYF